MGEVFRARDTKLGRDVALKVLPDRFAGDRAMLARFESEAKAVAALSHPNILALFDVGEENGVPFAVTELLEGETLRALLLRGPLPVKRALEVAREVAEALAAAHEKGIVHRDVKPENVFLTRDGHARLLDFGLARHETTFHSDDSRSPTLAVLTEAGAVVGTVAYMSPEQARGLHLDHRTDQFSLGTVLYEMLAGKRAFRADTPADVLTAIIRDEPEPLDALAPSVPVPVRLLLERLLAKDPAERWDSTRDLARDLAPWASHGAGHSGATQAAGTVPEVPLRRDRRAKALVAAGACAALAAALAAGFRAGRTGGAPSGPRPTPVPKLVQLTWEQGVESHPSVSSDGGSFVYEAGPEGKKDVFLRRVGGENPTNLTSAFAGDDTSPDFSPDGTSIAFRSERDGGGIFVMGATGESPRRLTDFGHNPDFSPDGKEIAFAKLPEVVGYPGRNELWVVAVASGALRKVYDGDGSNPSWSPSGSRIAFDQERTGSLLAGQRSVSTIPASGGAPAVVVKYVGSIFSHPAWTGGAITFEDLAGGTWNTWRVAVDEATGAALGDPVPLLTSVTTSKRSSWSRDGRRMLFASSSATFTIERVPFDPVRGRLAGEPQGVVNGPRQLMLADFSPDGEWLATVLLDPRGRKDIVLVRARTGETRRLTDDVHAKESVVWAPDGSKIFFAVAPEGTNEVWSVRPDGSERKCEVRAASEGGVVPLMASPDRRALHVGVGKDDRVHSVDLAEPSGARRLLPDPFPPAPGGRSFRPGVPSPDGRWIAGLAVAPGTSLDKASPCLYDVEARACTELPAASAESPCGFLPDSRRFLFRLPTGEFRLLDLATGVVSPAGSLETTGGLVPHRLSPDGRSLYGTRLTDLKTDIWMLDYGTGPRQP